MWSMVPSGGDKTVKERDVAVVLLKTASDGERTKDQRFFRKRRTRFGTGGSRLGRLKRRNSVSCSQVDKVGGWSLSVCQQQM